MKPMERKANRSPVLVADQSASACFLWLKIPRGSLLYLLVLVIPLFLPLTARAQTNCTSAPSGLIDWWPADGFSLDVAGTDNGILQGGVTFTNGEVGQAFNFAGATGLDRKRT